MTQFQIAAGTIVGRNHSEPLVAKSNQDAFLHRIVDDSLIAIVCDGCSGGTHSEVGSNLGVRLIMQSLSSNLARLPEELISQQQLEVFLERIRQDVLAEIRVLANKMGGSFTETIGDYFLFTVVCALVTPHWTCIFANGDGVYGINGDLTTLGPYDNQPPYFCYSLVNSKLEEAELTFQVKELLTTSSLDSLLVGSDGVHDLLEVEERNLPGHEEIVGPISQFWEEGRYFDNPDNLRRRLALANQPSVRLNKEEQRLVREKGLLPDDTTLVVIRRKPEQTEADDAVVS